MLENINLSHEIKDLNFLSSWPVWKIPESAKNSLSVCVCVCVFIYHVFVTHIYIFIYYFFDIHTYIYIYLPSSAQAN